MSSSPFIVEWVARLAHDGSTNDAAPRRALDVAMGGGRHALVLARALHIETDGNPFFVTEVLRHVSETGAIEQNAQGRWVAKGSLDQLALPSSLREVIGVRVGRVGPVAGRVLGLAAVIGRDFDLDLLAKSSVMSEDDLLDVLDQCVGASLVHEITSRPGHYNFAHALIQHAIVQDLGPARRARTSPPILTRPFATLASPATTRWPRSRPTKRCATTPKRPRSPISTASMTRTSRLI